MTCPDRTGIGAQTAAAGVRAQRGAAVRAARCGVSERARAACRPRTANTLRTW
ncbi:hypothetical protein [Streptomyces sp. NPDC014995]|uniref:hypothetical protein n=1 Tax=Streptomyces sp. NPDC014995 TaxID=3364936 RepID=UPI0036F8FBA3